MRAFFGIFMTLLSSQVLAEKVAVVVIDGETKPAYAHLAQARIEKILESNGIQVFDEKELAKLKSGWKQLQDPAYVLTAEDFIENSKKYQLDGIYQVSLTTSHTSVLSGFYMASAQSTIRYVMREGGVKSQSSYPMGAKGNPTSDGITETAATINAVLRAVDTSMQQLNYQVVDPTNPMLFSLGLVKIDQLATSQMSVINSQKPSRTPLDQKNADSFSKYTCMDLASDQKTIVAGAYNAINRRTARGLLRSYESSLEIYDQETNKKVLVEIFHPLDQNARGIYPIKIQDCRFLIGWRYTISVSSYKVVIFDTERGVITFSYQFTKPIETPKITLLKSKDQNIFVDIQGGQDPHLFSIDLVKR